MTAARRPGGGTVAWRSPVAARAVAPCWQDGKPCARPRQPAAAGLLRLWRTARHPHHREIGRLGASRAMVISSQRTPRRPRRSPRRVRSCSAPRRGHARPVEVAEACRVQRRRLRPTVILASASGHHRPGQGDRDHQRGPNHRRAHDVRGLGGDAGLGADLRRRQRPPARTWRSFEGRVYDATPHLRCRGHERCLRLKALAHCVDSLWAPIADPINAGARRRGQIRALAAGCPGSSLTPAGLPGGSIRLYAAYVSALAFASAGAALHHKICHVLGGKYKPGARAGARHGPALRAPHSTPRPRRRRRRGSRRRFGTEDGRRAAGPCARKTERPRPRFATTASRKRPSRGGRDDPALGPAGHPRPVSAADLERLLHAAWAGTRTAAFCSFSLPKIRCLSM